jgi:hypothetical protein
MTTKPLLVPLREAFTMLGCGVTKGYELVNAGLLDVRKMGSRSLATMSSIERCAEELPRIGKGSGKASASSSEPIGNPGVPAEAPSATRS